MSINIKPIIICGGSGTRLWPLSRESFSKQFVPLIEGKSLLDLTLGRVKSLGPQFSYRMKNIVFLQDLLSHDPTAKNSSVSILLEAAGRNTPAAVE